MTKLTQLTLVAGAGFAKLTFSKQIKSPQPSELYLYESKLSSSPEGAYTGADVFADERAPLVEADV